jgi:CRP/FNR family transcriptional regulator, cyclic AMP receptor protein
MDSKLELLRRVPLLAGLGSRELEEVGRLVDEIDLPAGRELTQEGKSGGEFFMIVDGSVRVERNGRLLREMGSGEFLGEIALIDNGPRTATATTASPVRLFVIAHRQFHSLLDRFPGIQAQILNALAARVRHLEPDKPH